MAPPRSRAALCIALLLVFASMANVAGAARPTYDRASEAVDTGVLDASVLASVQAGKPTDAIVAFDGSSILAQGRLASRSAAGRAHSPSSAAKRATEALLSVTVPAYASQEAALDPIDGVEVTEPLETLPLAVVEVRSPGALLDLVNAPDVTGVREVETFEASLAQSLPIVGQPEATAAGHDGAGTAVAVVDTGVDYTHAAFGACVAPGGACKVAYAADFAPEDGDPDEHGHGTNVGAIVVGVAPETKILALDVFAGTSASSTTILQAIDWTIQNQATYGTRALNMSLAASLSFHVTECGTSSYAAAFANVRAVGIVPVVSAGNDAGRGAETYTDGVASPSCAPGALRIGATYDANLGAITFGCTDSPAAADKVACWSQGGPLLGLLAPGSAITAGGSTQSGTSQAAPHVAGGVAVLADAEPTASAAQIEEALVRSGPVIPQAPDGLRHHRLDLPAAVAALQTEIAGGGGPELTIDDVIVNEGDAGSSTATFTVTLDPAAGGAVTVNGATANATASAPGDYTETSGLLTIPAGQTSKTIEVTVLGDLTDEQHETFVMNLSGASGATIADDQGVGLILDEDTAVPGEGCTHVGTEGDDTLIGGPGDDIMCGLGGNDILIGKKGDDELTGGPGEDTASYQGIKSAVRVNIATQTSAGGGGADDLDGIEWAIGGSGNDKLMGDGKDNFLAGSSGNDTILGRSGSDFLRGENGDDLLDGGPGNDTCPPGRGLGTVVFCEG